MNLTVKSVPSKFENSFIILWNAPAIEINDTMRHKGGNLYFKEQFKSVFISISFHLPTPLANQEHNYRLLPTLLSQNELKTAKIRPDIAY
jgi:hypothetical protein